MLRLQATLPLWIFPGRQVHFNVMKLTKLLWQAYKITYDPSFIPDHPILFFLHQHEYFLDSWFKDLAISALASLIIWTVMFIFYAIRVNWNNNEIFLKLHWSMKQEMLAKLFFLWTFSNILEKRMSWVGTILLLAKHNNGKVKLTN